MVDRGGSMTTFDRAAIAEAVHQAICQVSDSDGRGMCAYYARAGAVVTGVVTGQEYGFNAGLIQIDVGDRNASGDLWFTMDPAASGYNGMEFHAWFVRRPPGATTGETITGRRNRRIEVVDLSWRHMRRN